MGLSHSYISQLERGGILSPSPGVLKRLGEVLPGLEYHDLLVLAGHLSSPDELGAPPRGERRESPPRRLGESVRERTCGERAPREDPDALRRRGVRRARVPLLESVPAGDFPVNTVSSEDGLETVELPPGVKGTGPFAALRVTGDSMKGAGILDGDLVIIDRGAEVESGEIYAVSISGGEPTLKRLRIESDFAVLEPANPDYEPVVVKRSEVGESITVLGRLVYAWRTY